MNHASFLPPPLLPAPAPDGAARAVQRAIAEARRGVAVRVATGNAAGAGGQPSGILALPAETATSETLAEFLAATAAADRFGTPPDLLLLLALSRSVAGRIGALPLPGAPEMAVLPLEPALLTVETLRALADPTLVPAAKTLSRPAPLPHHIVREANIAPHLADAALQLAKLARLLPAVLVAPCPPTAPPNALLGVTADDVLSYPANAAAALVRVAEARVPLDGAEDCRIVAFRPPDGGIEHLAILIGAPEQAASPLVRVHSECFTGDLLGSRRCDCGPQLHQAIRRMAAEGAGVLLYMAQEGRGIGLVNKLRAYTLQDAGLDTLDANRALGYGADERSFAAAATMLRQLGIVRVRLLTNNPEKIAGLTSHGIEIAGRISHAIAANGENDSYLETKARRFGHLLG